MIIDKLFVLIACEESQAECIAFRNLGHTAFSCDIQKCKKDGVPGWHILGDVTPYLQGQTNFFTQDGIFHNVPRWDLIIAHPPCTFLCKVGSVHLYKNKDAWRTIRGEWKMVNTERWQKMKEARKFFFICLNAAAKYVAVENPCPMAAAQLPKADAYACPSWYGFKYTKKTYYWLKNLPPPMAEFIDGRIKDYVKHSRGKYRSRTFSGLANALAKQWSEYVLNDINNNFNAL